ncbi:MAG TPA: hypothetical protein VEI02_04555, partial [Planctomycetota bacterium]|nr:hypothetical protein [Planctomycetota bacterium]
AGGGDDDEEQVVEVRISAGSDTRPSATTTRRARPRTERLRRSDPFVLTYDGKLLVIGGEEAVRRTRASLLGQAPTLGGTPAFQRLPQQAQTYTAFTLKSMFADGSEFGAAFGLLKDLGSIGAATTVEDDRVTITYNRAPGQFIGMMIGAAAIGEDARDETAKVRDALAEIARKTNEFAQQHKKWPASLADLGYGGGKTPTFPDEDGKPKAIVFLPPKVAVGEGGYGDLLAYWDCSDYGRLAVDLSGYASTWSESRFLTAFAQYNTPK